MRELRKAYGWSHAQQTCLPFGGVCMADACVHWTPIGGTQRATGAGRDQLANCRLEMEAADQAESRK